MRAGSWDNFFKALVCIIIYYLQRQFTYHIPILIMHWVAYKAEITNSPQQITAALRVKN